MCPRKKPGKSMNADFNEPTVKVTVYHCGPVMNGQFIMPAFFTTDKAGAEWYLTERGDGKWNITQAIISFKNPFIIEDKDSAMAFIDMARRAGIAITVNEDEYGWEFSSQEIVKHFAYEDGTNYLHLLYIPAMREQLQKEGCDGVQAWDALENTEIPVYIAISRDTIQADDPEQSAVGRYIEVFYGIGVDEQEGRRVVSPDKGIARARDKSYLASRWVERSKLKQGPDPNTFWVNTQDLMLEKEYHDKAIADYGINKVKQRNQWFKAATGRPIEIIAWHSLGGSVWTQLTRWAKDKIDRDTLLGPGWYGARDADIVISITHQVPEPYVVRLENPYVYTIDDRAKVLEITNQDLKKIKFKGHDGIIIRPVSKSVQSHDRSIQQVIVFSADEDNVRRIELNVENAVLSLFTL